MYVPGTNRTIALAVTERFNCIPRGSREHLAKQQAPTAKHLMTIMNQLDQQIQRSTKRKRRRPDKRDGRSFWQPDGTKEVKDIVCEAWSGLWQVPPPSRNNQHLA